MADFKQRIEFENKKKKIMSLFPEDRKIGLKFTDIAKMMGFPNPTVNRCLKSLIEDGFLEKKKVGKRGLYFNRMLTYRGSFDIWDLMGKIDQISQKKGRVIKDDLGLLGGLCSVLVYGCLPYEKLTPLEREMVFQLMNKFRTTFLELTTLIDGINFRKNIEKHMKLPETCKNIMFGDESGLIDYATVDKIYGDSLWNYIFNHYKGLFHFQLTKGYMDIHGLKDLFNILDKMSDTITREEKKKGPFGCNEFPETEISKKIPIFPRGLIRLNADTIKDNAMGVMITPSPRCLGEYSDQVGWIIKNQIELWKIFEFIGKEKKRKDVDWEEVIQTLPTKRKRKEWLKKGVIEGLLLRYRKISNIEKKLMINDPLLNKIFDKRGIREIIDEFNNLYSRLMYFYKKKEGGKSLKDLKKGKKWFTDEEIKDYVPIDRFVFSIDFFQNINKEYSKTKNKNNGKL